MAYFTERLKRYIQIIKVSRSSLLGKMILTFTSLIVIPLLIVGIIAISSSSSLLIGQMKTNIVSSTTQTSNYFDLVFSTVYDLNIQLNYDGETQDFLNNKFANNQYNIVENETKIKNKLMNFSSTNAFVVATSLIRADGNIINTSVVESNFDFNKIQTEAWYKKAVENLNQPIWFENALNPYKDETCISIVTATKSALQGGNINLLIIDLKTESVTNHLSDIKVGKNDLTYAITPLGRVVAPKNNVLGSDMEKSDLVQEVVKNIKGKKQATFESVINGKKELVSVVKSEDSQWTFFTVIPKVEVVSKSQQMSTKIILLGLVFVTLAVVVGTMFSLHMNKRLHKLLVAMGEAEQGKLTDQLEVDQEDEIGKVMISFNSMLGNIKSLILQSKQVTQKVQVISDDLKGISDNSLQSSSQISIAIEEIACSTEGQTKDLDKCVVATENLAEKITTVVEHSGNMYLTSKNVQQLTDKGMKVITNLDQTTAESNEITAQVVSNINELNAHVSDIDKIAGMIQEVSEKTRYLSLNAAIEAARAGEYGGSFSVLAEEIRKLAGTSEDSMKDIQKIIRTIWACVGQSIELASKTEKAMVNQTQMVQEARQMFVGINGTMKQLIDAIQSVAEMVQDMDANKNVVLESIQNMFGVSEENSGMTEEVASCTQIQLNDIQNLVEMSAQLRSYSEELTHSMEKFSV